MSDKSSEKNKKYELVTPDGGYGYFICVSFIVNCSTITMFMGCFGILYNDFIIDMQINSTTVTSVTGVNAVCFAISGFLTKTFLKFMSLRKLCLLSVILHDAGMLGMAFVKSIPGFFICQGVLVGIGFGITYTLSCSIMNDYFVKRRVFAFSLAQFFVALLGMVAPIFVKWSLQEYGFRGTAMLVAGIMMQNIVAVFLMQPVEWHLKRVEIMPTAEMQPLLVDEKNETIPTIKLTDEEKAPNTSLEVNVSGEDVKKSVFRRVLDTFLDVDFAKKFVISCACIGPALATFAENTFTTILPQALYAINWDQQKVALAVATYSFGDLAMRTVFILFSKWLAKIGTQQVYVIGMIVAFVSRFAMLWCGNEIAIFIFIVFMGVGRCFIIVLINVVISEAVHPDKFTEAMGIAMMFCGLTIMILGPAIGAIRDLTDSYNTAFYILTSCFVIVSLFWSIELCYKSNKEKKTLKREIVEKIKSTHLALK